MPIRFRCAYCNQLMGIAHRKAGTVVHCPKCKGQIVVPTPEGPNPGSDNTGGNGGAAFGGAAFDRADFEDAFDPGRQSPQVLPQSTVAARPSLGPAAQELDFDVMPTPHRMKGLLLTPGLLALACALVVILIGLAFFVGLLLGRSQTGSA